MDRQRCTPYPPSVNTVSTPFYLKLMPVDFYIVIPRVSVPSNPPKISVSVNSHYLQVRVAWLPELNLCGVLNPDIFTLSVTSMFVTDVILLLIMLVGLLRLRLHIFGLGQLLWKQVG
jgi:hypothetical protein